MQKGIKEKTAVISILLNILLTVVKYITFLFTASMAILGEAYHSLSDILTSILVYVSLKGDKKKRGKANGKMPLEYKMALAIGIFIFIIGIVFIINIIIYPVKIIKNPLISGIIFILFSFGSYIVYRFETTVGVKECSLGLIADGMHSKTDMITSLITGFSLILYYMGINLDLPVAIIITIFIFSFAIETIINVVINQKKKGEKTNIFQYTFHEKIMFVFNKIFRAHIRTCVNKTLLPAFKKHLYGKKKLLSTIIIMTGILFYLSTIMYIINPGEEGIIERFSKPINYGKPVQPGFHVKLPYPIDRVIKVDSKKIRQMNIGNTTDENSYALLWTKKHGTEEPFISGDNNFFYPYIVLQYNIKDIFGYCYEFANPEFLLENIAYNIMTAIFAEKEFYTIATTYRKQCSVDIKQKLQEELDRLHCGIRIVDVLIKDVHPPIFIADSFENVIVSIQQKEQIINEAYGYKNKLIPETKGNADKNIKAAESYAIERKTYAEGEAIGFLNRFDSYGKSKTIIRKYLYIETIKKALAENNKIVVDPSSGLPEIWLKFDKIGLTLIEGD